MADDVDPRDEITAQGMALVVLFAALARAAPEAAARAIAQLREPAPAVEPGLRERMLLMSNHWSRLLAAEAQEAVTRRERALSGSRRPMRQPKAKT